jgi:hypothetical protein
MLEKYERICTAMGEEELISFRMYIRLDLHQLSTVNSAFKKSTVSPQLQLNHRGAEVRLKLHPDTHDESLLKVTAQHHCASCSRLSISYLMGKTVAERKHLS